MPNRLTSKILGINIQHPWASLLLTGKKTIETRFYPVSAKYVGKLLAVIETPGPQADFVRRIAGFIVFGKPFQYPDEATFRRDKRRHLIKKGDLFDWAAKGKPKKWAWPVEFYIRQELLLPKSFRTGMVYSKAVPITRILLASLASQSKGKYLIGDHDL